MPASSLVRFANRHASRNGHDQNGHDPSGQKLFYGRVDRDGYPFRGTTAPMYTEEEFEDRKVTVADPHVEFFNMADPAQVARYIGVLDGAVNRHCQIIHVQRFVEPMMHYVEWLEFFIEDGSTRTPTTYPEMPGANAQFPFAHLPGPSGY